VNWYDYEDPWKRFERERERRMWDPWYRLDYERDRMQWDPYYRYLKEQDRMSWDPYYRYEKEQERLRWDPFYRYEKHLERMREDPLYRYEREKEREYWDPYYRYEREHQAPAAEATCRRESDALVEYFKREYPLVWMTLSEMFRPLDEKEIEERLKWEEEEARKNRGPFGFLRRIFCYLTGLCCYWC
jgi:hypothetical protein